MRTIFQLFGANRAIALAALAASLLPLGAGLAQDGSPGPEMSLGATTHFAQGWPLTVLSSATQVGVAGIRDELAWNRIETSPGTYDFSDTRTNYLDVLGDTRPITIVFNYPNDHYDDGGTPHSDAGRTAFARFIVATLDRFPNITNVEIGNEFNGQDFVFGTIHDAPYSERAGYYFAILKAVYDAVKLHHPQVTVLGGAAHSIPVGYFRQLFALGALDTMDGVVIHPYTSDPEHVATHIAILNAAMGADAVPIYATEFGKELDDPNETAPYLMKMATALAASGVTGADWYALRQEPYYRNMGLVDLDGTLMPAGKAFRLAQTLLRAAGSPTDVSPDPFTYAFQYGDHAMVLWGEPRTISLAPGIRALDSTGSEIASANLLLDPDNPLVLLGRQPVALGASVTLGPQALIADSYHQFDWTNDPGGADGFEGPWSYHVLRGTGSLEPLHSMDGGTIQAEGWHPYIGHSMLRPVFVTARAVLPADFADGTDPAHRFAVVERFTADRAGPVDIRGTWQVHRDSEDGVTLDIIADGSVLYRSTVREAVSVDLPGIALQAGSTVDFIVGVNSNPQGNDTTRRHIQIVRAAE